MKKKKNLDFVSRRLCFDSTQTNVFWCAYKARGTSEYLPITRSWFAAELSQCLDKMADVNSVVKHRRMMWLKGVIYAQISDL